jgi:hypothetical protein
MPKKLTNEQFIQRSFDKHGSKFIYLSEYEKAHSKIKIKCTSCNCEFEQLAYSHMVGRGCTNCCNIERTKTHDEFIKESNIKYNNQFEYLTKYINAETNILIKCKKCNIEFKQPPRQHLLGVKNCPHVHVNNNKTFLYKANIIHNNKFKYITEYINDNTKIQIECLECSHIFYQKPSSHTGGVGCPKCAKFNHPGGYNKELFELKPEIKNNEAWLYLYKFWNEDEEFYKIGITMNIKSRHFTSNYNTELIRDLKTTLYNAFIKEQEVIKYYRHLRYIPKEKFGGYTECFKPEICGLLLK